MRTLFTTTWLLAVCTLGLAPACGQEEAENIDEQATHEQVALIKVDRGAKSDMTLNAFCLTRQGEILAACGNGPGEIRVFDGEGKFLRFWEVPVKPESVNTAPDGTVLVAGSGKLFRYSTDGEELHQADSPHARAVKENAEKIREEAVAQLEQTVNNVANQIEQYARLVEQLETKKKKEGLKEQEQQILDILPENIERLKEYQKKNPQTQEISERQIKQQVEFMTQHKMRMASVSADDNYVYAATPALSGYGFEVWRLDPDFEQGEVVISDLRGCCGQMDVQACSSGVYVAENARHRVVCLTSEGDEVTNWGQRDRTGLDGFTSCCNPMNVCFNTTGDVYTAESNTGRIKRFSSDGKFLDFVGDVKLVPGCKNVSIAVTGDGERVYMLDITRNHIVLMQRKSADAASDAKVGGAE